MSSGGDWGRLHASKVHYVLPGPFPRKACDRPMGDGDRMSVEFSQVTCLRCRHYPPVLLAEGRSKLRIGYEQRAHGRVEGPVEDPATEKSGLEDHFVPGHVLLRAGDDRWDECVVLFEDGVVGVETHDSMKFYSRSEALRLGEFLVRAARERPLQHGGGRVHVLWRGVAICGFSQDVPAMWPEGHRFVDRYEVEKATCRACQLEVPRLPPDRMMRNEPELDVDG